MSNNKKKEGTMAEKSVKKTTAKKAVTKKTTAKKTTTKKVATKKTPVKKAPVAPVVADVKPCGCDKNCACQGNCHEHCACHHKCGFFKKFILFLIIFALGFVAAKMCCCKQGCMFKQRPTFENGCLVVKCPKMQQMIPMMDANHDGCVSKEEFGAHRKQMKHKKHGPAKDQAHVEAHVAQ